MTAVSRISASSPSIEPISPVTAWNRRDSRRSTTRNFVGARSTREAGPECRSHTVLAKLSTPETVGACTTTWVPGRKGTWAFPESGAETESPAAVPPRTRQW